MKTKVLAITILLCCLHAIYVFGATNEKKNYTVEKKDEGIAIISVTGDCEIVVADLVPKGEAVYGDKVGENIYGGKSDELFNKHQAPSNDEVKGIKIYRNSNGRVMLKITYSELEDLSELDPSELKEDFLNSKRPRGICIYLAKWDEKQGYCPNLPFFIIINKCAPGENTEATTEAGGSQQEDIRSYINDIITTHIGSASESSQSEVSQLKDIDKELHDALPLLITLLIGLFLGYLLFKQNRKALKKLSKECSDLKNAVANLEKNNVQAVSHQATPQKDSMTEEEIKRFVVQQIKSLQTQFAPSQLQPSSAVNPNVSPAAKPAKKEEQATDTDNVKYHQDDNSFTLEQGGIKIFRIYSKGGEYYYTIVNDSTVREELIGTLQTFEGCLTYQTTDGVAKRIEPVKDGKLRKDGNKFYVDVNNKLVVKFA